MALGLVDHPDSPGILAPERLKQPLCLFRILRDRDAELGSGLGLLLSFDDFAKRNLFGSSRRARRDIIDAVKFSLYRPASIGLCDRLLHRPRHGVRV
jgi:hypothetical protein